MHALLPKPHPPAYQANIIVHDRDTRQRNNPQVQRSHILVANKNMQPWPAKKMCSGT